MAIYKINYTDITKIPIFLNSGILNSSILDITLIGMDVAEYGVDFDNNTLHILENFAAYENPNNPGNPDLTKTVYPALNHPTQGELWFNKSQSLLFFYTGEAWEALMLRDNVSGNSGIIVHGVNIPLPSGITSYNDCSWFVSPQYIDDNSNYIECYTDENALVYSRYRSVNSEELIEGLANYIIIGIQNLDNEHIPFPLPSVPPAPSLTPTPSLTISITPTITISSTSTPVPGATRTATPTITPTLTPTSTSTQSVTPTISLTPASTNTPTPTPSMTVSVSSYIKIYVLNAQVGKFFISGSSLPVGFYNNGAGPTSVPNYGTLSPNINSPVLGTPYFNSYAISQLTSYFSRLQFTLAAITGPSPPQNAFNEISFVDNIGASHTFFANASIQFVENTGFFGSYPTSTWIWQTSNTTSPPIFFNNTNYIITIQ